MGKNTWANNIKIPEGQLLGNFGERAYNEVDGISSIPEGLLCVKKYKLKF